MGVVERVLSKGFLCKTNGQSFLPKKLLMTVFVFIHSSPINISFTSHMKIVFPAKLNDLYLICLMNYFFLEIRLVVIPTVMTVVNDNKREPFGTIRLPVMTIKKSMIKITIPGFRFA